VKSKSIHMRALWSLFLLALLLVATDQAPTYTVTSISKREKSYTGTLQLTSGAGPYGADVTNLKFAVVFETENRIRVKIADLEESRWQVPYIIDEDRKVKTFNHAPAYNVRVSNIGKPFALEVTRANGDMIFNTTSGIVVCFDWCVSVINTRSSRINSWN
jgi:alpha-glucosidase